MSVIVGCLKVQFRFLLVLLKKSLVDGRYDSEPLERQGLTMTEYHFDRDRFKTIPEGCAILDISDSTLKRWRKRAAAESFKIKKVIYFDMYAVRECMERHNIAVADNPVPVANPVAGPVMADVQRSDNIVDVDMSGNGRKQINVDSEPKTKKADDRNVEDRMAEFQKWLESTMANNSQRLLPGVPEETHIKVRKMNRILIIGIISLSVVATATVWYFVNDNTVKQTQLTFKSDQIIEQGDKIDSQGQRLEQAAANIATLTTEKKNLETSKQQIETKLKNDLNQSQAQQEELMQTMQQLTNQIKAAESENLLLLEEIAKLKIDKLESTEAEPNGLITEEQ